MSEHEFFRKEKVMVTKALHDEQGEIKLRKHLRPLVDAISEHYSVNFGVPKEELMEISWTHFLFALTSYRRRLKRMLDAEHHEQLYSFGLYFVWYVQQSIETYLGISEKPLRGIKPKYN